MKKWVAFALAASAAYVPAEAAVIVLTNTTTNGANNFTFNYQATIGPDEGLRSGDRFIIFDFAGYIAGSANASPNFTVTIENSTAGALLTPGQTDDASLANLVFTYTGPNLNTAGGPFTPVDFALSARSTFGGTARDAFYTQTTKNNPAPEAGSPTFQIGTVLVPQIPEPASWAMMIGGFGLIGAAARRRRPANVAFA